MATNPVGDLAKLPGEIIAKSIESLTSNTAASTQTPNTGSDQTGKDEALKRQIQAKDKAALDRVMSDLERYRHEQAQILAQKQQSVQDDEAKKKSFDTREKQKRGNVLSRFFKSIAGTGEASKMKG